jgi:transposase
MNVRPGGKQAHIRDGWFIQDGEKIVQSMIFPPNHSTNLNKPKGIKAVLTKRGLYRADLRGKCKKRCESNACCNKRILELQSDFAEQKSLVQETIKAAGHLCLFLPKFHCELNPIEYFWGMVKKYLRNHCNYSFDGLKENLPKALDLVPIQAIRWWEHQLFRWVDAYRAVLGSVEAQLQVKQFSSRQYKSHRQIPENVATHFD